MLNIATPSAGSIKGDVKRKHFTQAEAKEAGSIKGDVKREHFTPCAGEGGFFDIQPPVCASTTVCVEVLGATVCVGGFHSHEFVRCSMQLLCACKQRGGSCQPWFYLRLEAYCFVGLSEGAYGGP
jgi:hypothetical protein